MTAKKDVVKKASQEVAKVTAAPRGLEDADSSELLIPRIELLQSMSPTVQQGLGQAGTLVNQISKTKLPTDIFIPIAMHKKYIKWIPRGEGGGVEYQTSDSQDPRVIKDTKWGAGGQKPSCTAYLNFLVLLEGSTLPIMLSFSMTSYQAGRKLLTMAKMTGKDIWANKYKLHSVNKTNQFGTFFIFDVKEAGITEAREQRICEQLYDTFSKRDLNFEVEGAQDKQSSKPIDGEDF